MAALTAFSQINASIADTFNGYHIRELLDAPTGRYRWAKSTARSTIVDTASAPQVVTFDGAYGETRVYQRAGANTLTINAGAGQTFAGGGTSIVASNDLDTVSLMGTGSTILVMSVSPPPIGVTPLMLANTVTANPTAAAAVASDLAIAAGNFVGRTLAGNLASLTPAQARLMLRLAPYALPFNATQNWDIVNGLFQTVTATANFTLNLPSNAAAGDTAYLYVTQDGVGGRTITFSGNYKFAGGITVALSTATGAVDRLELFFRSATVVDVAISKAWA